ncbi:hypothetical protein BBJ28_00010093 [Nothophytophthora sp. Chile5]|nr:hypothetical protein BBJ28_00010093 [Nothophytophthora sp. Chile5]
MKQMSAESDENTAYDTRDTLRKTFGVVVYDPVESGMSDNGTSLSAEEYVYVITDRDRRHRYPWFIGEIDDGTGVDTLEFKTVSDAFNGSMSSWTKTGDGSATIMFQSLDTEDVPVNVISGDDDFDEIEAGPWHGAQM